MRVLIVLAAVLAVFPAEARPLSEPEAAVVQEAVRSGLRDPESARFRLPAYVDNPEGVYCGWVNAKNGLGGYAGFARFIVAIDQSSATQAALISVSTADPDSPRSSAIAEMCAQRGY